MRFLLIDRITAWEPGVRAEGTKNVALSEDFFDDHFPLKPIMPGVLILEGMSQLAGILLEESIRKEQALNLKALLSIVDRAKFRHPVYPGDSLGYETTVESVNEMGGVAQGRAHVGGKLVAECRQVFSFHAIENPGLEKIRDGVLAQWLRGLESDGQ